MALYLDVSPNDVLRVGPDIFLTVERKSGARCRLRIVGTAEVELMRGAKDREGPHQHALAFESAAE